MRIQSVLRCAVSIVIVVVGAQYPSPAQGLDIDRVTSLTVGLPAVLPLPLYTAVAASSDFGFPCALQVNGRITCWGAWWTLPGYRVPEGRFIQVSTGGGVGCGLEPAGRVTCWGSSQFATTHVPEGIYRQVSVGDTFVCGLRETGSIICWGYAGLHATQAPKGTFTQVSAGVGSACGLRSNGRVACWGDITGSQGEHLPRHPAGTFSQISAGIGFGCGLRADASIACWGTALLADQTSYSAYRGTPVTNVPAGIFKQLSSGGTFACGMRTIGSVTCWGEFTRDQSKVPGGIFTQISAGQDYACGMRRTGMIACWGYGGSGATMVPTPASYMPPPRGNPPGVHYFRLTHHSVAHAFLVFYNAREGSLLFGLPLTEAFSEGGALVQYFEHSRLVDSHGHISITPLGVYVTKNRLFAPELQRTILGRLWFPATGHTLSGAFLTFWQTHHGALVFGSPLSEPLHEQHVNGIDRT